MFCQNCGKELENNTKVCSNCGSTISNKIQSKNILLIAITSIIILAITISMLAFVIVQQNNKSTITISNNDNYLEKSIIQYPIFTGSRVLVEVKTNNIFTKPNKEIMNATQYRLEQNLIQNGHYEPIVQQVSPNKFIVYIEDEFDEKVVANILELRPVLEFKKHISDKSYDKETFEHSDLTIADLKSVSYEKTAYNGYIINIKFNKTGTKKFANLTKELIGKQLAIFVNGELMSAPTIQETITGGTAQISGGNNGFSLDEAKEITDMLNASIIPTTIKIVDIK